MVIMYMFEDLISDINNLFFLEILNKYYIILLIYSVSFYWFNYYDYFYVVMEFVFFYR